MSGQLTSIKTHLNSCLNLPKGKLVAGSGSMCFTTMQLCAAFNRILESRGTVSGCKSTLLFAKGHVSNYLSNPTVFWEQRTFSSGSSGACFIAKFWLFYFLLNSARLAFINFSNCDKTCWSMSSPPTIVTARTRSTGLVMVEAVASLNEMKKLQNVLEKSKKKPFFWSVKFF